MLDMMGLLALAKKLDAETAGLFTQFVVGATRSGNPNEYVKAKLRVALSPEPPPPPKQVKVEVLEQDGRPVGSGARVRRNR